MGERTNPFDQGPAEAAEYDAWYESPQGRAVLEAEQDCVARLIEGSEHPWLDLGTGSGRFGGKLGAEVGLDPAPSMLRLASRRIPSVVCGAAEELPFREASLGAVFSVTVFEFLPEPSRALGEIARALRPGGRFVLGFFPRGGPWAALYEELGRDPQSVFHAARFYSADDIAALAAGARLRVSGARSTLFEAPESTPTGKIVDEMDALAGFVALAFTKLK